MLPTNALYLILKEVLSSRISEYKDEYEIRLKTQKFIYLFEQMWGEDLYNYSWYLAGPYSSTLTNQIYNNLLEELSEKQIEWDKVSLSEDAISTIKQVQDLISQVQLVAGDNFPESKVYELVASLWYIAKKKKYENKEDIKKELILNKPHFKDVNNLEQIISLITKDI